MPTKPAVATADACEIIKIQNNNKKKKRTKKQSYSFRETASPVAQALVI